MYADRVVRLIYFLRINESAGPHLHESEASQIPAVLYKIRRRMDSIYWLSLWMYPPPHEDRDRRHGPHGGSRNSPWPVAAVSMDAGQGASAAVWSEEGDAATLLKGTVPVGRAAPLGGLLCHGGPLSPLGGPHHRQGPSSSLDGSSRGWRGRGRHQRDSTARLAGDSPYEAELGG